MMASGFTARTALLGQMAQYGHDFRLAAGDIVRSCLNDSVYTYTIRCGKYLQTDKMVIVK